MRSHGATGAVIVFLSGLLVLAAPSGSSQEPHGPESTLENVAILHEEGLNASEAQERLGSANKTLNETVPSPSDLDETVNQPQPSTEPSPAPPSSGPVDDALPDAAGPPSLPMEPDPDQLPTLTHYGGETSTDPCRTTFRLHDESGAVCEHAVNGQTMVKTPSQGEGPPRAPDPPVEEVELPPVPTDELVPRTAEPAPPPASAPPAPILEPPAPEPAPVGPLGHPDPPVDPLDAPSDPPVPMGSDPATPKSPPEDPIDDTRPPPVYDTQTREIPRIVDDGRPGAQTLPWLSVVLLWPALLLLPGLRERLVSGAWSAGKILSGLFTRFTREDSLDHPARRTLHEMIQHEPGIFVQELVRRSQMARPTVLHHLYVLERLGLVSSLDHGRQRHLYPAASRRPEMVAAAELRRPLSRAVAAYLLRSERSHQAILVRVLGVQKSRVSKTIGRLHRAGLVMIEKVGRRTMCRPTESLRRLL